MAPVGGMQPLIGFYSMAVRATGDFKERNYAT